MIINYIKERFKRIREFIELVFYYYARCNSAFPHLSITIIIIYILIFSYPIILQIIHRFKYFPEEQIQFLDTTYQPLSKVNEGSIEEIINYNEILSIARNTNNRTENFNNNLIYNNEKINKIKNKPIEDLEKDKLGKFISIVEHVNIDTINIVEEYQNGRRQGVINKDTFIQAWKILNLIETVDVEIPNKYLLNTTNVEKNNKKININDSNINSNLNFENNLNSNNINKDSIKIDLDKNIPKKTFNLRDICLKNKNNECIIHSPFIFWNNNITKLEYDDDIFETITSYIFDNKDTGISYYSVFGGLTFSSSGKVKSSNNLILTFFLESSNIPNTSLSSIRAWNLLYQKMLNKALVKEQSGINISQYKVSNISKELSYNNSDIPSEYLVLFFIYIVLFCYISTSIGKAQFVKSKYTLGFVAVVSVSLSLIISLGFIELLLGINSTMFIPWSVFPYLIVIIGVENIVSMVKSVVNTSIELPFTERYSLGMKNISFDILISLIINILIIGCGYFSKYDQIIEFCFYTSITIVFNFFLQFSLFGTALFLDIRKLELYDLYTIQTEQNHRIIEHIGSNKLDYENNNENNPYHPLLNFKNEEFSDVDSNDGDLNKIKSRKIHWNWTILFIVLSIMIFGSNINEGDEEMETVYYSDNYNKTYSDQVYSSRNDYPSIITSISHIIPQYWTQFKDIYNEKMNIEESSLSSLNINYYVVMNSLLHISVDAEFIDFYEPRSKVMGINVNKHQPYYILTSITLELLTCILSNIFLTSCIYLVYLRIVEYSKRIKSSIIHIIYYFFPFYEYEDFRKDYIIPLYQPYFITRLSKDKLEKYQSKINYTIAYTSSFDMHIINGGDHESIDYIIIKNPNQMALPGPDHDQSNNNSEDEKAIILWGSHHGNIYIWSSEPLINKSKAKDKKVGVYYYRNPYIAKAKYLEPGEKNFPYHLVENIAYYINKPTFKCNIDIDRHINDLSIDVFNDYILMANKKLLYQWEYYNKKINYFDIIKDDLDDEILWILNSNENYGENKTQFTHQYHQNVQNVQNIQNVQNVQNGQYGQFYDHPPPFCSQPIQSEKPYFIIVVTKKGKIISLDANKNIINTLKSKETLSIFNYIYRRNNSIILHSLSKSQSRDSLASSNINSYTNDSNDPYYYSQHNTNTTTTTTIINNSIIPNNNNNNNNNNHNHNYNNHNNYNNYNHNHNHNHNPNHNNDNDNNNIINHHHQISHSHSQSSINSNIFPLNTNMSDTSSSSGSSTPSASSISHSISSFYSNSNKIEISNELDDSQSPVCYHYDKLNRLWISFKNKMIVCYQLPLLQPLFVLNENDMNFTVLSPQAQNEININKSSYGYWKSRHNKSTEYDHYINKKLFISRKPSIIMTFNEEVGWLVTSDATGYMTVWNIKEGKVWDNVKCPSQITHLYILKSTSKKCTWWIVSSHDDETVRLWSTNAGILSCSEVWYQPGCNTIACYKGVIAGVRRVCIRENTVVESFILQVFINIVLIVNFIANIFIHHVSYDFIKSIDMIYHILKQIHNTQRRSLIVRTFYIICDTIENFFHFHFRFNHTSFSGNRQNDRHHHHHHHHHRFRHTNNGKSKNNSNSNSNSFFSFLFSNGSGNSKTNPEDSVWMWQIWLYNVDTEMYRYINFSVDRLNGLGVPKQRIIYMPRSNILFQIYDLSISEDVNGHPSFTSKFKNQFKSATGSTVLSENQQTLRKYMKKLSLEELGSMYNEIPSDINIENLGLTLNIEPFSEFFLPYSENITMKDIEEKERVLRKTYNQPPVIKINHIKINSRLICIDFGNQVRVFSFKDIIRKRNIKRDYTSYKKKGKKN